MQFKLFCTCSFYPFSWWHIHPSLLLWVLTPVVLPRGWCGAEEGGVGVSCQHLQPFPVTNAMVLLMGFLPLSRICLGLVLYVFWHALIPSSAFTGLQPRVMPDLRCVVPLTYVRYYFYSVLLLNAVLPAPGSILLTDHQWAAYSCKDPQSQPVPQLVPSCTCTPLCCILCPHCSGERTRLVLVYTAPSQKYLILHRTHGTKGVVAFTSRIWGSSGISPVQVLSPVSTSAPRSGRILLHSFTRRQQDRSRAH